MYAQILLFRYMIILQMSSAISLPSKLSAVESHSRTIVVKSVYCLACVVVSLAHI